MKDGLQIFSFKNFIHLEIMRLLMPIRVAYCYSLCVSVIHRMHQDRVIAPFGFGKTKEQPQSMKWTCLTFNPKPPPLSGFPLHSHNLSCLLTLSPAPFTHLLALIFAFEPLWKLRTFENQLGRIVSSVKLPFLMSKFLEAEGCVHSSYTVYLSSRGKCSRISRKQ